MCFLVAWKLTAAIEAVVLNILPVICSVQAECP